MSVTRRSFRVTRRIVLGITLAAAPAQADMTKDQCVDANGDAQELRGEGKLSAAREKLRACASPSCPAMVRDDCVRRLDELERAQPTIAFEVKDAWGADVSAVKVAVDSKPLTDRLDGTALRVDIGQHVFTFEVAGQAPVTRTLVLTEGEKGRREVIAIGGAKSPASVPAPSAAPVAATGVSMHPVTETSETESPPAGGGVETRKLLGLVAGGVGVAGLAVGSVFGVLTLSEKSQQQKDCASSASCTGAGHTQALSDHSLGMTDATISTTDSLPGERYSSVAPRCFSRRATASNRQRSPGCASCPA